MEKTSQLLKNGLDQYPDDPEMSKEEYQKTLPKLIQDLTKYNMCG